MFSLIWNTFKWLAYAVLATAAVLWLRTLEATVQIQGVPWLGDAPRPIASVAIVLALLAALIALLYHGYKRLWMAPRLARERRVAKKQTKGIDAVSKGLIALAAGDADEALKQARTADGKLSNPGLTKLITAQSAQMKGDEGAARKFFTEMLDSEDTRFLGLRGLVTQDMKTGDRKEALLLAREAKAMQPKSQWALDALFELETKAGNMIEAEQAVREQRMLSYVPSREASHKRAVLLAQQAANDLEAGESLAAIRKAKDALALDGNLPATRLTLPKAQLAEGRTSAAAGSIEAAWKAGPMEEMIALYLTAKGNPEGKQRRSALEKLASKNDKSALSNILRAELAIEADDWEAAKKHLDRASELEPTERGYKLLAAVEQRLTNDAEAVRAHLTKAIDAKSEGAWLCSSCGTKHETWSAVCPSCNSFDTVGWIEDGTTHTQGMTPRLLAAPAAVALPADTPSAADGQILLPTDTAEVSEITDDAPAKTEG